MRIIAGPCLHESYEQSLEIAHKCKYVCDQYGFDYYFKASYDKANRTSVHSPRGNPDVATTLIDFYKMKIEIPDLKILTDFHSVRDIELSSAAPEAFDVIQIPAFLSRQTDLIKAAADTGKIVNIKKGQFMAPWDIEDVVEKADGAEEVWITERGTSFGYDNLVVDFNGLQYLNAQEDFVTFFDATHSVQKIDNRMTDKLGNQPSNFAFGLLRAASAIGVHNFFMEVHPDPSNAPCDGRNMIHLNDFQTIISQLQLYRNPV